MSLGDGIIAAIAALTLIVSWIQTQKQNEILAETNEIMKREKGGKTPKSTARSSSNVKLYWPVVATAFLAVATWSGIAFKAYHGQNDSDWIDVDHLQTITRQSFGNENVDVDGKRFEDCRFNGTHLVYNGNGEVEMLFCNYSGPMSLTTASKAINVWLTEEQILGEYATKNGTTMAFQLKDKNGQLIRPLIAVGEPTTQPQ